MRTVRAVGRAAAVASWLGLVGLEKWAVFASLGRILSDANSWLWVDGIAAAVLVLGVRRLLYPSGLWRLPHLERWARAGLVTAGLLWLRALTGGLPFWFVCGGSVLLVMTEIIRKLFSGRRQGPHLSRKLQGSRDLDADMFSRLLAFLVPLGALLGGVVGVAVVVAGGGTLLATKVPRWTWTRRLGQSVSAPAIPPADPLAGGGSSQSASALAPGSGSMDSAPPIVSVRELRPAGSCARLDREVLLPGGIRDHDASVGPSRQRYLGGRRRCLRLSPLARGGHRR